MRITIPERFAPISSGPRVETDGGVSHEDDVDATFTTYISDEYRYRIEYPVEWIVDPDPPGGMFFSACDGSSAIAFVFVEDTSDVSLDEYIDGFFDGLAADEYIYDLERREETETTLPDGQLGKVIEYAYIDDAPCEQWCCTYLFVIADGIGYTIGIDWEATDEFKGSATRIIDSFALLGDIQ